MKPYWIACVVMLFFAANLSAQPFHFPDSNAVWSVYQKKFFVAGDSTHNGITYRQVNYTYGNNPTGSHFALFRHDTLLNKVYRVSKDYAFERLLYDFTLDTGETTTVYPMSEFIHSGPVNVKVDSIDSVQIAGKYRKRMKIVGVDQQSDYKEYWIEGIGSTFGPFNSGLSGYHLAGVAYPKLICFEQDSILIYDDPDVEGCSAYPPMSVSHVGTKPSIDFFPNPADDGITIISGVLPASYKLLGTDGRLLMSGMLSKSPAQLNLTGITPGLYLLELSDTRKSRTSKVIIK